MLVKMVIYRVFNRQVWILIEICNMIDYCSCSCKHWGFGQQWMGRDIQEQYILMLLIYRGSKQASTRINHVSWRRLLDFPVYSLDLLGLIRSQLGLHGEIDVAMGPSVILIIGWWTLLNDSDALLGICQGFKNEINGPKHLFPSTSSTTWLHLAHSFGQTLLGKAVWTVWFESQHFRNAFANAW